MSRLVDQIKEALAAFVGITTPPALIGGLALAVHHVVRATQDVDFLVDADDADHLHALLQGLGYRCIHRSQDAANYLRGDEGLDLLFAHRPVARRLLSGAEERDTGLGRLRVITAEGLIAFKLGYINDPSRSRDLEDIRNLLRSNPGVLDMAEIREFCSTGRQCSMNSSRKSNATRRDSGTGPVLVSEGGVAYHPSRSNDPVAAWMDLMEAVEALCPRWPARPQRLKPAGFRL